MRTKIENLNKGDRNLEYCQTSTLKLKQKIKEVSHQIINEKKII